MSVLKDKLLDTYNSSKLFYDNYISNSKIDELNKNFNKFRLYYLNLLSNVKI
jgi:hypothetical protein